MQGLTFWLTNSGHRFIYVSYLVYMSLNLINQCINFPIYITFYMGMFELLDMFVAQWIRAEDLDQNDKKLYGSYLYRHGVMSSISTHTMLVHN